jgi:CheY-like chemotaxis protein
MIYLIDDKKERQHQDFGWSGEKFAQYADFIKPLYSIEEIAQIGENLYNRKNTILYHESFLDFTNDKQKALEQRRKLQNIAETKTDLSIAFFSGSQGSRSLNGNIAHLPVSKLYQNLEITVKQQILGAVELKYLLYGEKPEIEEELYTKITQANKDIEKDYAKLKGNNLFIRPTTIFIQNAINGAIEVKLFNDVSDEKFSEKLNDWLSEIEYDNIFLPLCFGPTLSDYNGLRLATHIRCTSTKNQLKRIFIYGFVGLDYLVDHEYFNILKTKNVELVTYSKKAFELADKKAFEPLLLEELPKEIQKLKLDLPLNYADSHSIANEWAIHQWAKTIGCDETDDLTKVFQNVQTNIYFKYLSTINPVLETDKIPSNKLKFDFKVEPKVLLIDDEAEKGWNEIFAYLLTDLNGIYTDYLRVDFKKLSSDEIIEKSIEKIFKEEIDIVILDFRLNPSDFQNKLSNQITSVKLLKQIKERNPGVQVIAFSATNKTWNLKNLVLEGANGFISKGDPNNNDIAFIKKSINDFIQSIQDCMHLTFLKDFYNNQNEITNDLIPRRKPKNEKPLPKEFVDEALKWLGLSNDILSKGYLNESKIVSSFVFKFSVLENISNRLIDTDNPIQIEVNEDSRNKYKFQFRLSEKRLRNFVEDENKSGYYRKTKKVYESYRNLPWVIKILNTIDFVTDEKLSEEELTKLVKKRNDFIHANPTAGDKVSISIDDLKFLNHIITIGLKNIV